MAAETVITLFSDARPQPRLSEDEVTLERLQAYFDAAVLDWEVDDDGDIYIQAGTCFPLWITLDHDAKSIRLFTYFPSGPASFEGVNALNQKFRIVQFTLDGDRVLAHYYMLFKWGIDTRHIITMIRQFSDVCRAGQAKLAHTTPAANQAEEA